MLPVKEFLAHVHSKRTIIVAGASNKIEPDEIQTIHEQIQSSIEEFNEHHAANLATRRDIVAERLEALKAKEEEIASKREEFKTIIGTYRENRE